MYKRMTMETVALAAGIHNSSVFNFEACKTFTITLICSLCNAYGLLPSTVFLFAESAAEFGLMEAYRMEAPHLLEARTPIRKKTSVCRQAQT